MSAMITDEQLNTLSEMIFQGRKIEAIKLYREMSNLGLKESKEAVEALEKSLRASAADKFSASAQSKGCVGVIAAGFIIGGLLTYWVARG